MASIYPNKKEGKIVSFKFKVFLGRDEKGKQQFKCKTWIPEKIMSESKLKAQAEKEAIIWERQVTEQINLVSPSEITFRDFVEKVWLPYQKNIKENKVTTLAFYKDLLKIIVVYLGDFQLKRISNIEIDN